MAKYFEVKNKRSGEVIIDDSTTFISLKRVTRLNRYTAEEDLNIAARIEFAHSTTYMRDTGHRHVWTYLIGVDAESDMIAVYTNQVNSNVCYALSRDCQNNTAWILEVYTKSGHQADFNPSNFWVYVFGPHQSPKVAHYGLEAFNAAGQRVFSSNEFYASIIRSGKIIDGTPGTGSYYTNHLAVSIDLPGGKRIAYCAVRQQASGFPFLISYGLCWPYFARVAVYMENATRIKFDQVNYFSKKIGTGMTSSTEREAAIYTANRCAAETSYLLFDVTHIPLPN